MSRSMENIALSFQLRKRFNIEYVEDFISEMKDSDHFIVNNEIQFKEIVNAFIERGINYNQMNILLIYRKEEQKYLRTRNINSLFNSQEITIIPADDGFYNGRFFVEPIIKKLSSIMSLAQQKSKKGLNLLGSLAGKLIEQGRYNDALGLEHTVTEAVKTFEIPVTILCLYNSIPADLEDRLSEYHDIIIERTLSLSDGFSSDFFIMKTS
jgi:hypothetical protein